MNVNSILLIRYSGLGDIIMLLPTIRKLKQKYNSPTITLLTDSTNQNIVYNSCSLIDEIITIDRKVFKEKKVFKLLSELKKLLINLRKKEYDLLIDFQNFGETATLSYIAKAKVKIGAPKKSKYNYGYSKIIKRDERGHRSQFFSRIAEVNDSLDYPKLCLNETSLEYKSLLEKKLDRTKPTIGLNIGSTQENRRWSEENFLNLAKKLEVAYNVVIFLGPSEKKFTNTFKDFKVVSDVNLNQLCGAISVCNYFISNDTGPVHIAAALNIPTLTLFSTGCDENVGALIDAKEFIQNSNINKITCDEVLEKLHLLVNSSKSK